jgi:hypothetical protein
MLNSANAFKGRIGTAREAGSLFDYLTTTVIGPQSFDDLLRFQIVYAVSAFDKLMHDLIRIGMTQTFMGTRSASNKYRSEQITLDTHASLVSTTIPPKEVLFEQEIARKLGFNSYQEPERVAEGLSLIWQEDQKWQKIGSEMGWDADKARKQLKLISVRRNGIVHEADIDLITNAKRPIMRTETIAITDFVELCGMSIAKLVT